MNASHTPGPLDFGPDFICTQWGYNAYRSFASGFEPITGRWFSIDYSSKEQIDRRAAIAKATGADHA